MKLIPYNNSYEVSTIDNINGSGCLPNVSIIPPTYIDAPSFSKRKRSPSSSNGSSDSNDNFNNTKPRIFPDRYIYKHDSSYRTTNNDEYDDPKIKEKIDKLKIPNLNSYNTSDDSKNYFIKPCGVRTINKTRMLSKEKVVLVGKVYCNSLDNYNYDYNSNNNLNDWNNPNK